VAIAARVVGEAHGPAIIASLDMTAIAGRLAAIELRNEWQAPSI
jgi:hypothetical protein